MAKTTASGTEMSAEQAEGGEQQSLFDIVAEFGGADNAEDIADLEGFIDAISQAETAYAEALHQDPSDTQYAEADGFAQAEALANDHSGTRNCDYDCDTSCDCDDTAYTDVRITRIVIDPAAVARKLTRAAIGVLAIGGIGYLIGVRAGHKD